ncbi:MAG: exodeoxyribonuclease III [Rickettsiales bacterium]|nr:exodeoxyribonuclease III [Rickettsiales bacterium]
MFRIASWNINSVRLRQDLVVQFLKQYKPDILALQETKTPDEHFPKKTFEDAGYEHVFYNGMKSYNGVCFISRHPLQQKQCHARVGKSDCRHVEATINYSEIGAPLSFHNLYIPAGGDEPNVMVNNKFAHKLDFVDEMTQFFKKQNKDKPIIALGDFNIAPYEHDVWSHKQLLKVVSHTPIEVEKLEAMRQSLDFVDAARHFVPMEEKLYSWWSYRARDWEKSDRGRRLDHIWVTPKLESYLHAFHVAKEYRGIEKPSDHAPIILDLKF